MPNTTRRPPAFDEPQEPYTGYVLDEASVSSAGILAGYPKTVAANTAYTVTDAYSRGNLADSVNMYDLDSSLPPEKAALVSFDAANATTTSTTPDDVRRFKVDKTMFIVVSAVSAFLILFLESFMFGMLNHHRSAFLSDLKYIEMSIYLALFIFAAIYQMVMTVLGLATKNMLLLCLLCVFYGCMLIYTGIQYHEVDGAVDFNNQKWSRVVSAVNISVIAVLAATLVLQLLIMYFRLWRNVRWFRFKKIGASLEMRRLYIYFEVHRSFLMFDFFFFLGFTVQFIVVMISNKTLVEFILTCCMLPLTILVLFLSDLAATKELLLLSLFTLVCYVGGCVYVLFKMVRLFTKYTAASNVAVVPGEYFPGRTSLVTFGVITLVFLFSTIALEITVMWGYNRGLLPYVETDYKFWRRKSAQVTTKPAEPIFID